MEEISFTSKGKITKLQQLIKEQNLNGYLIPCWDEYMSEYTPRHAKRLEFATNFSGSNGIAVILPNESLFFTDGRYLEQAKKELDLSLFKVVDQKDFQAIDWASYGDIGYDPKLFTKAFLKSFPLASLKSITKNLVDEVWEDRHKKPESPIYAYDEAMAGRSYSDKLSSLRNFLKENSAAGIITSAPDSVCWLLNLRSNDVEFTPMLLAMAIVTEKEVYLFTDEKRFKDHSSLRPEIKICPENALEKVITQIEGKILFDELTTSVAVIELLTGKNSVAIKDPCRLWKAIKNNTEINYAIEGHIKDATALCEFLAYIDRSENLDQKSEYDLGLILSKMRAEHSGYVMDSFPAICGFKGNGAIIHYRATEESAQKITGQGLLLIDSGGQYMGATTDVTRTVAIGTPTVEQKKRYTEVLKGHIALANARFPKGTSGSNLDVLARQYLWQNGEDYAHGTGHGVGSFLSVHEGPHGITLKNTTPLEAGMIVSNEPGYYKAGEYGIRIENLIYVKESETPGFLEFENLTLVPYDKNLIDLTLITKVELEYLKSYYEKIVKLIGPNLSPKAQEWLDNMYTPLA
jgi:Xaa-Pro aminopeptidase